MGNYCQFSRVFRTITNRNNKCLICVALLLFLTLCSILTTGRPYLHNIRQDYSVDETKNSLNNNIIGLLRAIVLIKHKQDRNEKMNVDGFIDRILNQLEKEISLELLNNGLEINKTIHVINKFIKSSEKIDFLKRVETTDNKMKSQHTLPSSSPSSLLSKSLRSMNTNSTKDDVITKSTTKVSDNKTKSEEWSGEIIPEAGNFSKVLPFSDNLFKDVLSKPILNKFEITYTYPNWKACEIHKINTIIAVPSGPGNFKRRTIVRNSPIALFAKNPKNLAKLLFFIGKPNSTDDGNIQTHIDKEQLEHGDIVQANHIDTYKNITMKAAMMFDWSVKYCSNAKNLLRTDDDIKGNAAAMISTIESQAEKYPHFIVGTKGGKFRHYNKRSKYFVSFEEWPHETYPRFLLGGAYGCPIKTAGLLLECMRRTPLVWLDDVFVTGICARSIGVPIFKSKRFRFTHMAY